MSCSETEDGIDELLRNTVTLLFMHLPYIIKVIFFFQGRCSHSRSRLIVTGINCISGETETRWQGLRVRRSERVASGSAPRGLGGELVQLPT